MIAIGQRVFVHCPDVGAAGSVALADETGKVRAGDRVTDGLEVEVVAWRPRAGNQTLYRVVVLSTGADGWLLADNLRTLLVPPSPDTTAANDVAASAVPPVAAARSRRRFGQHFDSNQPRGPRAGGEAAPSADDRGRRFGQRF